MTERGGRGNFPHARFELRGLETKGKHVISADVVTGKRKLFDKDKKATKKSA
mgnify:CR=1 FL=1